MTGSPLISRCLSRLRTLSVESGRSVARSMSLVGRMVNLEELDIMLTRDRVYKVKIRDCFPRSCPKVKRLKITDKPSAFNVCSPAEEIVLISYFPNLEQIELLGKGRIIEGVLSVALVQIFPSSLTRFSASLHSIDEYALSYLPKFIFHLQIRIKGVIKGVPIEGEGHFGSKNETARIEAPLAFPSSLTTLLISTEGSDLPIYQSLPSSLTDLSVECLTSLSSPSLWALLSPNLLFFACSRCKLDENMIYSLPPRLLSLKMRAIGQLNLFSFLPCLPHSLLYFDIKSKLHEPDDLNTFQALHLLPPNLTGLRLPIPAYFGRPKVPELSFGSSSYDFRSKIEKSMLMETERSQRFNKIDLNSGAEKLELKKVSKRIEYGTTDDQQWEEIPDHRYWIVPDRFSEVCLSIELSPENLLRAPRSVTKLDINSNRGRSYPSGSEGRWEKAILFLQNSFPLLKSLIILPHHPKLKGIIDKMHSPLEELTLNLILLSERPFFPNSLRFLHLIYSGQNPVISVKVDLFIDALPVQLEELRIGGVADLAIPIYFLSKLPRSLITLECHLSTSTEILDENFTDLPPHLENLYLYLDKTFSPSSKFASLLPSSIKSLHIDYRNNQVPTVNHLLVSSEFFRALPKRLEEKFIGFHEILKMRQKILLRHVKAI